MVFMSLLLNRYVSLLVWTGLRGALRQPKTDGGDFAIGQVFMSRHIGSGNSEFGNLRQTSPSLCAIA
jgi:hypothetical protein